MLIFYSFLQKYKLSFTIKFQELVVLKMPSYDFALAENNHLFSKKHVNCFASHIVFIKVLIRL